jgi:hypothetical protein
MNILRPHIECKHNGVYIWQNCKSFAGELKQTPSVKVNLNSESGSRLIQRHGGLKNTITGDKTCSN